MRRPYSHPIVYFIFFLCIGFHRLPSLQADPVSELLDQYKKNAAEAHSWTMQALFDIQLLYTHVVQPDERTEYENIFALPIEDPMYIDHESLFCKTFASVEWQAQLNRDSVSGRQTLQNAYANFTALHPDIGEEKPKNIKAMKPLPDQSIRFTIPAIGSKTKSDYLQVLMPPDLQRWHHAYSLWYPLPQHIGIPDDPSHIVMTQGDDGLYVLMYTPTTLEEGLFTYLVSSTQNPQLQPDDLVCTMAIDPVSYTCKSFDIKLRERDNPQQSLFTISSFSEAMAGTTVPIPTRSLLLTEVKNITENGDVWSSEYYCRIEIKNFVRK